MFYEMKQILKNKIVSKLENLYAIKVKENLSPYTKLSVTKISFDESDYIDYEVEEDEFIQLLEEFLSEMKGLEIDIEIKVDNEKPIYRKPNFIFRKSVNFNLEEFQYDLAEIADFMTKVIEFNETINYEGDTEVLIRLAFVFYNTSGIHFRENEYINELHFYNHIRINMMQMF